MSISPLREHDGSPLTAPPVPDSGQWPGASGGPLGKPRRGTLWLLGWRLLWNHFCLQITRDWLRSVLLVAIAAILWTSLSALTRALFDLLTNLVLPPYIIGEFSQLVLGALAVGLTSLLAFSAGLACYLELFRAPDVPWLLCSPLRDDQIFAFKWFRTLIPGVWTLGLLVLPVLLEWTTCVKAPWWAYGVVLLDSAGLLVLAASFGCLVLLLVVWLIPAQSRRALLVVVGVLIAALAWWLGSLVSHADMTEGLFRWLRQLVQRLRPTQWFLAPSHWWSYAVTKAVQGQWREALFATALLWSNALVLYLLSAWLAGRVYRTSYAIIASLGDRRRYRRLSLLSRCTNWFEASRLRATWALLTKDLLTLFRDPVQWAQLGVLAGVLAIYFWTVSALGKESLPFYLRRILHILNLAMVALTLATWGSRFLYPLVAQEIRAFWLLGIAPVHRTTLLRSKWIFASLLGIGGAAVVLTLSHLILQMDTSAALLYGCAAIVLGVSVAGTSVGLAGLFVQPHELSPTQPLSSYGNTLTLLVCTALALLITGLAGVPVFMDFQAAINPDEILQQGPSPPSSREGLLCLVLLLVGSGITGFFFYLGQRRFQRLEW